MFVDQHIRLRHLRTFLEVSRTRSIGQAALALAVTQPAVSKTIRELEMTLGIELFDRSRRVLELTPLGKKFLTHAENCLLSLKQGIDTVTQARSPEAAPLHIGALPTVSARLLPAAIRNYKARKMTAIPEIITGPNNYLMSMLRSGDVDFVIGRMNAVSEMTGLTFEHLYSEQICFVVRPGHPLLKKPSFNAADLHNFEIMLPTRHVIIRPAVERMLLIANLDKVKIAAETVSTAFGRAYTRASDVIWIISQGVVLDDIADGTLVSLPIQTSETLGPVGITRRADSALPVSAEMFMKELRAVAAHFK